MEFHATETHQKLQKPKKKKLNKAAGNESVERENQKTRGTIESAKMVKLMMVPRWWKRQRGNWPRET